MDGHVLSDTNIFALFLWQKDTKTIQEVFSFQSILAKISIQIYNKVTIRVIRTRKLQYRQYNGKRKKTYLLIL
jgi:hypothetical protein